MSLNENTTHKIDKNGMFVHVMRLIVQAFDKVATET